MLNRVIFYCGSEKRSKMIGIIQVIYFMVTSLLGIKKKIDSLPVCIMRIIF